MTDNAIPLRVAHGSHLCTISYWRMPDGSIRAEIQDMPAHVIEAEATITKRFFRAAQWSISGMLDLMRQGIRFDDETRAANETEHTPEPKGKTNDR